MSRIFTCVTQTFHHQPAKCQPRKYGTLALVLLRGPQAEFLDFNNTGMLSVLEISHHSKTFDNLLKRPRMIYNNC